MKLFIKQNEPYTSPITYTLRLLGQNKGFDVLLVNDKAHADVIIDDENETIPIADVFYNAIEQGQYNHKAFTNECIIRTANGIPDYLATAFYMINCMQELDAAPNCYDAFGRYKYESSYQYKFGNVEDNLVQRCFDLFCGENKAFSTFKPKVNSTKIFLSHDIDTVYGSLAQDGFWALKRLNIKAILKLITNEVTRRPTWLNIDKILKIHNEYELKSTFFWIVNKGLGADNIKNADYSITSNSIQQQLNKVIAAGSYNGLHKSCSHEILAAELKKLPVTTVANRYHFLRFSLPNLWESVAVSTIKMDASLGFAETYGFRNSYGLPFSPYSFKEKSSYNFVEVPLNIMDTTFHKYQKVKRTNTASTIIDFVEKNKSNCLLSVLWHNTYFTDYKYGGYLAEYKKLLTYFYENKLECITPDEIITEYL